MKIGILTLPLETNYGGNLQAFAMQRTLRKLGHEAITIDRHNLKEYPSLRRHLAGYLKRLFQHYIQGKKISAKWNPFISAEDFASSASETQKFIDRNIVLTRRVYSNQLEEIEDEYQFDAYVVGSDQVWLAKYCPASFLDFVKRPSVKKLAYAASCGKSSFFNDAAKVRSCKLLAESFNGISVREESLVSMCKTQLGIDAKWVLDPTMLLCPEDYLSVTENNVDSTPIVFSYILDADDTKSSMVDKIASQIGLPVVNGNRIHEHDNAAKVYPSVDDWIRNISRSKFVVTDSFHGTVFAILFNKQFIAIGNATRGMARFESLLRMFGLEDRLVTDLRDVNIPQLCNSPIDYPNVNAIIERKRVESLNFIINSLK